MYSNKTTTVAREDSQPSTTQRSTTLKQMIRRSMPDLTSKSRLQSIPLPRQDLAKLSFCPSKPAAVAKWAESLPLTRTTATAAALYKLLPELSRLSTSAEIRMEMLEAVRLQVQQVIRSLCKDFLNKPIILPERSHKTATIAQALQKHMSMGYFAVIRDLAQVEGRKFNEKALTLAIHRALSGLSRLMLRSLQLYVPVSENYWEQVHTLYQTAEEYGLLLIPSLDPADAGQPASTIRQLYLRILLFGCVRANQLRQSELDCLHNILNRWVSLVQLNPVSQGKESQNLFAVDLRGSTEPIYKSHIADSKGKLDKHFRELDTSRLLQALIQAKQQRKNKQPSKDLELPTLLNDSLIVHLLNAWGTEPHRDFKRIPKEGAISALAGTAALHFHLADKITFEQSLGEISVGSLDQTSRFMHDGNNVWDSAADTSSISAGVGLDIEFESNAEKQQQSEMKYVIHTGHLVDYSPAGYCIEWNNKTPQHLRTGELMGLKEAGRSNWSIAAVRWLRQAEGHTRCGVELLSPMAAPYAASVINPSGEDSEYLRVFLLPAMPALKRAKTLLTPNVPFTEGCKVKLNWRGREQIVLLTKKVYQTCSLALYEIRNLDSDESQSDSDISNSPDSKEDFSDILDDF